MNEPTLKVIVIYTVIDSQSIPLLVLLAVPSLANVFPFTKSAWQYSVFTPRIKMMGLELKSEQGRGRARRGWR
jgi:hypothetical protein